MRIIFDLRNVGLGNNGGSLTLIKCGNTLTKLGHEVFFIDSGKNCNTWEKILAEHIIVKRNSNIPDAEAIIATGYRSCAATLSAPERCGKKFHYIRGWEVWQGNENWIRRKVLEVPTIKIVNSIGLQQKLKTYNVSSTVLYPGYDLDKLYPTSKPRKSVVIGGLYTVGKHEQTKRPHWVIDCFRALKSKYNNIDLHMFGTSRQAPVLVSHYVANLQEKQKNSFYNSVNIWLSPSILEGLHLPPAEAMMTGCPVVGVDTELCGTKDYLVDNVSGLVSKNTFDDFLAKTELLVENSSLRKKLGEQARRTIEKIGSRESNMKKFVTFVEEQL